VIGELDEGEFVYVRMQVTDPRPTDRDSFRLRLVVPAASTEFATAAQYVCVGRSQIVAREPKVMEADNGIVRGV
jgi:hypothetical protein